MWSRVISSSTPVAGNASPDRLLHVDGYRPPLASRVVVAVARALWWFSPLCGCGSGWVAFHCSPNEHSNEKALKNIEINDEPMKRNEKANEEPSERNVTARKKQWIVMKEQMKSHWKANKSTKLLQGALHQAFTRSPINRIIPPIRPPLDLSKLINLIASDPLWMYRGHWDMLTKLLVKFSLWETPWGPSYDHLWVSCWSSYS